MLKYISVAIMLVVLSGCTSQPVRNIDQAQVSSLPAGKSSSMAAVEKAILSAAQKRGWVPRVVRAGLIEANITVRIHTATIEIPYTDNSYSIIYKDSTELDYKEGNIHRNYNKWVSLLSETIQQEFAAQNM